MREQYGNPVAKYSDTMFFEVLQQIIAELTPQQLRDLCETIIDEYPMNDTERGEIQRVIYNLKRKGTRKRQHDRPFLLSAPL